MCGMVELAFWVPSILAHTYTYTRVSVSQQGYQSLHTGVFLMDGGGTAEVQIRTARMHREAEYGGAAHALYKACIRWMDDCVAVKKGGVGCL